MDRRLLRQLEQRLGRRALRQRLDVEHERRVASRHPVQARRGWRPLGWMCVAIRLTCRVTGLYGIGYRQFHRPHITRRDVTLPRLPRAFDGLRVLHLSDLHLDLDTALTATLIAALASCGHDLCVMTGDYRNLTAGDHTVTVAELRRILAVIPAPAYGVLGNHDDLASVPAIEALGLRLLLNESVALRREDAVLHLAGIDDPNIYGTHRLDRALRDIPRNAPVLLLSHSPAIHAEAAAAGVDLVLAGHIHGGQICLPGGGILLRNDRSPRRVWRGAWQEGATQGYTSRGTGACGVPLRFFCPPEIVIHTLRAAR